MAGAGGKGMPPARIGLLVIGAIVIGYLIISGIVGAVRGG